VSQFQPPFRIRVRKIDQSLEVPLRLSETSGCLQYVTSESQPLQIVRSRLHSGIHAIHGTGKLAGRHQSLGFGNELTRILIRGL
jgi:hypothetical protein